MRFESVRAHRFGPLREQTLDLAPGMNVVYGPNEAGKSSWHAALYAGLCGVRRGKGAPPKNDRLFAERHKPWDDGDAWEVGAVVELTDGRRVALRHDLAGRVDSSARDADLAGRDYSAEILFEGSPDGSTWLGLNRKSFLSTACIRQRDIVRIRDDAEALQQVMQRAADTAGVDATAAAALARLADFRRDSVGSNQAPTKPLRTSMDAVKRATEIVATVRERHALYLERREEADGLERGAQDAQRVADAARAALAEAGADDFEARVNRARALNGMFPDGAPHPSPERGDLADQVTAALTRWTNRPALAELTGPTTGEIATTIADSDAELDAVRAAVAEREADEAERRLERAIELDALFPDGPPRLTIADDDLAAPAPRARRRLLLLAASCLAIVGGAVIALALPDLLAAGATVAGVGVAGVIAWGAMSRRKIVSEGERRAAPEAQAEALRHGQDLRMLRRREREQLSAQWDELQGLLAGQPLDGVASEAGRLRDKARLLIAGADQTLVDAARRWSIAGDALARLERKANTQRNEWENQRGERRAAEDQHRRDTARISAADDELRAAAKAVDVTADDADGLASALGAWRENHRALTAKAREQGLLWDELQRLLGERSLEEMEAEAVRLRNDATARAADVDEAALADARARRPGQATLAALQADADAAREAGTDAHIRLEEFANTLGSVADAEDALAAAACEHERIAQLDQTLARTIDFLERAQDRVHRDIAPILRATVLEWLPGVTGGRYTDCRIDPESLAVEVAGPDIPWRDAALLSHGTTEQVYLLLRLALARHLTKQEEVCPLILDDVVSASDVERKRAALETLLVISESTQIILFTHENDVRDWARVKLSASPAHRLIELARESDGRPANR